MYSPNVVSAREVRRYKLGSNQAVFFDNIVTSDIVQYTYMAILYGESSKAPLICITSEVNTQFGRKLMQHLGIEQDGGAEASADGGSHFYCVFDQDGHHNYGASDDWGQAELFERETLKMIAEGSGLNPTAI